MPEGKPRAGVRRLIGSGFQNISEAVGTGSTKEALLSTENPVAPMSSSSCVWFKYMQGINQDLQSSTNQSPGLVFSVRIELLVPATVSRLLSGRMVHSGAYKPYRQCLRPMVSDTKIFGASVRRWPT